MGHTPSRAPGLNLGEGKKKEIEISQHVLVTRDIPQALGNDVLSPMCKWARTRPQVHLPSLHTLPVLTLRSFPSFKVLVAHSFHSNFSGRSVLEATCWAPGPPGSECQSSQSFQHDWISPQSVCCHDSFLKASGLNPQGFHRSTLCLKGTEQKVFPPGRYKWNHLHCKTSNFSSFCHYCYNSAFSPEKSTSGVIWRILSVCVGVSTLISPQVFPFSLKILWFYETGEEGHGISSTGAFCVCLFFNSAL